MTPPPQIALGTTSRRTLLIFYFFRNISLEERGLSTQRKIFGNAQRPSSPKYNPDSPLMARKLEREVWLHLSPHVGQSLYLNQGLSQEDEHTGSSYPRFQGETSASSTSTPLLTHICPESPRKPLPEYYLPPVDGLCWATSTWQNTCATNPAPADEFFQPKNT